VTISLNFITVLSLYITVLFLTYKHKTVLNVEVILMHITTRVHVTYKNIFQPIFNILITDLETFDSSLFICNNML